MADMKDIWTCLLIILVCIGNTKLCDVIEMGSFGRPLRDDFYGYFKQRYLIIYYIYTCFNEIYYDEIIMYSKEKYEEYHAFYNEKSEYYLWRALFRGDRPRWSIGKSIGDDGTVIGYKDSQATHPSHIERSRS